MPRIQPDQGGELRWATLGNFSERRQHRAPFTNGPTEAINNLVKRVKRVAFGIMNWTNYRTRALLYAGRPDWTLLTPNSR